MSNTEREIIESALRRQGIMPEYNGFTGELRANGAILQFKPDGELADIRGFADDDDDY